MDWATTSTFLLRAARLMRLLHMLRRALPENEPNTDPNAAPAPLSPEDNALSDGAKLLRGAIRENRSAGNRETNDLHGTGGVTDDKLRDAAHQKAIQALASVGADHDEIGLTLRCAVNDGGADVAFAEHGFGGETSLAQMVGGGREQGLPFFHPI